MGINMMKKRIAGLIAFALLMLIIGGCSNTETSDKNSSGQGETAAEEGVAMGRYIEEKSRVEGELYEPLSFTRLSDGGLLILDYFTGGLISEDEGGTWQNKEINGFQNFIREEYVIDMKAASDGTIAILHSPLIEDTDGTFQSAVLLISPEGEETAVETAVEEADSHIKSLWFAPDGRLFGVAGWDGSIYEINVEEGICRLYLKAISDPKSLHFQGNYMMIQGRWGGMDIYDMEAGKYLEDEVLKSFIEENYAESSDYLILTEEEGSIYIAGKEGLHRHVIGGSAMEQVIDGSLSSFGDPSLGMIDIHTSGEDGFVVLLSSGELSTFTYHPEIPTVPTHILRAYSLEESSALRQAIIVYQRENPDVYVEYEIGMNGTEAVTREDALKKLNVEIMAGKGPDLLVLDSMPMDSWLEKGMLLDISSYLAEMDEGTLLPNIVESFTSEDKTYMMPATVMIPILGAKEEYLAGISDLSSLADEVERLRREYPGMDLMQLISQEITLNRFMTISEPFWFGEGGEINREIIADYLTQTKRIYNASMEGISRNVTEKYEAWEKIRVASGESISDFNMAGEHSPLLANGESLMTAGNLSEMWNYACLCSVKKAEGMETFTLMLMPGYDARVFQPVTLTGISTASSQPELAAGLLMTLLGAEVQSVLSEGGFPVNEDAMAGQFVTLGGFLNQMEAEFSKPGNQCGMTSTTWVADDGTTTDSLMDVYFPELSEEEELKGMLSCVNMPYIPNTVLEEAVYKAGVSYYNEEIDLEEAVTEIEQAVKIKMAE